MRSIKRREFLKKSACAGLVSLIKGDTISKVFPGPVGGGVDPSVIAVAEGNDYAKGAAAAVEMLGGITKFVSPGSKVAVLPNSQHKNLGTYTKPEIVGAVIKMCQAAGAKEVNCLSWLPQKMWDDSGIAKVINETGANLKLVDMKDESIYKKVAIPNGKTLKETKIMQELYANDILINVPITKDHIGNKFTGTMKNLMGLNLQAVNMFFHTGKFKEPDDIGHLDQCIADLNTVVKPTLCIVDATEFITTNGPFGPGKIIKPRKIVAGTDRIAVDSYCTTLLGLTPADIIMIKRGYEHGLGEIDLNKIKVKEVKI